MSANEANGGKPVKTMFEDEKGELQREQRRIMRPFGHTSRDGVYWLGIRRGAVASPRSGRTNPRRRSPRVRDLGQTNPSHRHAGIAPNGLIYTIVG
jgi:hypothetical protein